VLVVEDAPATRAFLIDNLIGPCARMPIASITLDTKVQMELGSSSRRRAQPCRSIAASMPQGRRPPP